MAPAILLGAIISSAVGVAVFFGIFAVILWRLATDPTRVLDCPYCFKRVKVGATVCHHCGRAVRRTT